MVRLKYYKGTFWIKTDFENRGVPLRVGFEWDRDKALFFTKDVFKANDLVAYSVDPQTREIIEKGMHQIKDKVLKSRASTSMLNIPSPSKLEYRDFQKAGIEFALKKWGDI